MKATIQGPIFSSVATNIQNALGLQNIKDEVLWKVIYILLRLVFILLKALHCCDSKIQVVNNMFYCSKRVGDSTLKNEVIGKKDNIWAILQD